MKTAAAIRHWALYTLIAGHVALKYLRLPPGEYLRFLRRAGTLLWAFRHNRVIKTAGGYKLQLYLPAYPSKAFFSALENKLLRRPPAPTSMVFSMTRACDYGCPHCYQKKEHGTDLPEALMLRTVKQVRQAGVTYLNIEGGEPFLRPARLEAVLAALDDACEAWVNTTGRHLTEEALKRLKDLRLGGLMISIHSPDPETHDRFTSVPGSFDTACRAMELCKRLGLGLAINSVLSEQELRDGRLPGLMDFGKKMKANFIQLIHPKPCGGWLDKTDGLQESQAIHDYVEKQHLCYNSWRTSGYPSLAAQIFEERKDGVGCTAGGIDRFYINAAGELMPCEFLQISFGNVSEEDFEVIFQRMRQAFAVPGQKWLCGDQRQAIVDIMAKYDLKSTPLRWRYTQELMRSWSLGEPTPLYDKLGIYRP
jgi:MoaA/NifB/PqqE/SkfB family radical SAM enzyme